MEKVKVTQEQVDALVRFNKSHKHSGWMETFLDYKERKYIDSTFKHLVDFTPEQFALVTCGWFEIDNPIETEKDVYIIESDGIEVTKEGDKWKAYIYGEVREFKDGEWAVIKNEDNIQRED